MTRGNESSRANDVDSDDGLPPELTAFHVLPELVVAIDSTLAIHYVNPFARQLTGHGSEVIGTSIIDLVHPDDIQRAGEVVGLILDGTLGAEVTPANYRLRCANDDWVTVEVTATPPVTFASGQERILIMGHYSGDTNLRQRVFDMFTEGHPVKNVIEMLPEFGTWRYPKAHYVISYPDATGTWHHVGSEVAAQLLGQFQGPTTPWALARSGHTAVHGWSELDPDLREASRELGLHGCMVLPVPLRTSTDVAVAAAWSTDPLQSVSAHRYALEQMASTLDVVLQWHGHISDLERSARVDTLSGLANRNSFINALGKALAPLNGTAHPVAVLYVDLDGFKAVNDIHGHAAGDAIISVAADRMRSLVGPTDVIGRIGGDEFAILCREVVHETDVTTLAERIVSALAEPFSHGGHELLVGASVGLTITESTMTDPTTLLAAADRALYQAKADGRGRWRLAR